MSRIPRPIAGCNLKSLPISPKEAFIFSRIDGSTGEGDLASITGLPISEVAAILERLASLGAIELPGVLSGPGPTSAVRPSTRPAASYDPKELEEEVEIDLERKRRILELYAKLGTLNHYELLGVPQNADKKQIKNAYYDLAPEVHPDKFFRKQLGSYKAKIEAIFTRITLAHDVLSSKQRRAEYDRELAAAGPSEPSSTAARSPAPPSTEPAPAPQPIAPLTPTATSGVMPVVREPLPVAEPASPEVRREALARKLSGGAIQKPAVTDPPPEAPSSRLTAREADDFLKRAEQLEIVGRFSEAALAYAKACAGRPDDARAHERAAHAALEAGINPRRIVEYARRAVELAPRTADYRLTLARAYAAAGLEESASGECARALELSPGDPRIRTFAVELKKVARRAAK